jgi:hypothetical protein
VIGTSLKRDHLSPDPLVHIRKFLAILVFGVWTIATDTDITAMAAESFDEAAGAAMRGLLRSLARKGEEMVVVADGSVGYRPLPEETKVPQYHDGVVAEQGARPFQAEILGGGPPGLRWVRAMSGAGVTALAAAATAAPGSGAVAWGTPEEMRRGVRALDEERGPVVVDGGGLEGLTINEKRLAVLRVVAEWRPVWVLAPEAPDKAEHTVGLELLKLDEDLRLCRSSKIAR